MTTIRNDELVTKVNEQNEQLNKYKKRLQDMVVAHKKLIAEKERLEDTLKMVTSSMRTSEKHINENADDSDKERYELNEKLSKLAQSLSSLADEKRRTEADFQTERKQLVQQNARLEEELKKLQSSAAYAQKAQEAGVKNLKTQLNLESNQRELDFASNIRELQKIITEERENCQEKTSAIGKLEGQLEDITEKLIRSGENEKQLQTQLNDARKQLECEVVPKFVMEKLKHELQIMREQHNNAIQHAQMRASNAEENMKKLTREHENCVSKLEQRLVQFSDVASNYDKHRQEDQMTIMKLKNHLMQLELENSNIRCEDDRTTLNEETLIQQLQHVKHQLILGCKNGDQLNSLRKLLLDGLENSIEDGTLKYQSQYFELKQRFEEHIQKYSMNENSEDSTSKRKVRAHKAKLLEAETTITKLKQDIGLQRELMNKLLEEERRSLETRIVSLESEYRNKTIMLERELQKQRERVTAIIKEKEKQMTDFQQSCSSIFQLSDDSLTSDLPDKRSTIYSGTRRPSTTIIYYLEEAARKDADISRLRQENNQLQMKLRDVEKELFRQIRLYAEIQQDIRRFEKQEDGHEELNNAYLKNVLLNYFVTTDLKMRTHMLNAIFAILKFSDLEINRVTKFEQHN